ncbi:carboxymuconolactone decarboxylase family protein [Janibacter sp. DB-40]|uniref:carboxymuconolactone decarboxylase family protein n=1 Tax=Janibacter sp. DB-40 TaxID=3028808 RepID=UPI002404E406|nr:carboxymuconolactone decarboxylase family protein [Janibacter sp. DB-40]
MSTTARIPSADVSGPKGWLLRTMTKRMFGRTPESIGVMWHHQKVFSGLAGVGRKVESWDELDKNLASLATMAAAARIGCSWCLDFGYFMAHNKGLDETKAREVPRWRGSDVFTPLERRVLEYAEGMSETPPAVTDELSAELLEELGAAGLIELTARVGFMNLSSRSNVALGIHSEEFADACGLPPLAAPDVAVPSQP